MSKIISTTENPIPNLKEGFKVDQKIVDQKIVDKYKILVKSISMDTYGFMIMTIILLFILFGILYSVNPLAFNKSFGFEIFVTLPILLFLDFAIISYANFKKNPKDSFLNNISFFKNFSDMAGFDYIIYASLLCIGILGFFAMLGGAGIFSKPTPNLPVDSSSSGNSIPSNNTAVIINIIIIFVFLSLTMFRYNQISEKEKPVLDNMPYNLRKIYELRTKYTIYLFLFIIGMTLLYLLNPWNIMVDYATPAMFVIFFVLGLVLFAIITIYQYFLSNPSKYNYFKDWDSPMAMIFKCLYVIGAFGISIGLIYASLKAIGVFNQNGSKPTSYGSIIVDLILFVTMLGIIYKLANAGGFLDKNPYYRLLINILFYIPCLLVNLITLISQLFGSTSLESTKTEKMILLISFLLLAGYFIYFYIISPFIKKKYLTQGGKQLVNQPIPIDKQSQIASFKDLSSYKDANGNTMFSYQYAISFWFYIDSFPPSTNSSYNKNMPILSYGDNPLVKYSSSNNTLYITVKQTDKTHIIDFIQNKEKEIKEENVEEWKMIQQSIKSKIEDVKIIPLAYEVDSEENRIIYKQSNVLLQKWNNIVMNYNGGTLDIFYNGKLVKSSIEVVPYLKNELLTVGAENGISGNLSNLLYFNNPIDIVTINNLYQSLKDKNPPSIPDDKKEIIQIDKNK